MKIGFIPNINRINYVNNFSKSPRFKGTLENDSFELKQDKSIEKILTTHNHPVRIFFSDYDGTIRDSVSRKVPISTHKALIDLQKAGIPFVIASGRCLPELQVVKNGLSITPKFFILGQGGHIIDENEKTIFLNTIDTKKAKDIINFYYKNEEKYPNVLMALKSTKSANIYDRTGDIPVDENWNVILFGNPDIKFSPEVRKFCADFKKEFGTDELNIDESTLCFEITPKGLTKLTAAQIVADLLKVKMRDAAAIGDAVNDISIVENIKKNEGLGIAMGNACMPLLKASNFITDTIENDGYSHAIETILRNNRRLES